MKIDIGKPDDTGWGYYVAELEIPEITENHWDVYGSTWYHEIDQWCEDTFGVQDCWGEDSVSGWKRMRNKYFFVDKEKLSWFLIRWL